MLVWARQLQGAFPSLPFTRSREYRKFRKGLGVRQHLRGPQTPAATWDQYLRLLDASQDPHQRLIFALMGRGAARPADIRWWLNGEGRLSWSHRRRRLCLVLFRERTDVAAVPPQPARIGPFRGSDDAEWLPLVPILHPSRSRPVPSSQYPTPQAFLTSLKDISRPILGRLPLTALRHLRARLAKRVAEEEDVGRLLRHRKGSSSTGRYTANLCHAEAKRRLVMTGVTNRKARGE